MGSARFASGTSIFSESSSKQEWEGGDPRGREQYGPRSFTHLGTSEALLTGSMSFTSQSIQTAVDDQEVGATCPSTVWNGGSKLGMVDASPEWWKQARKGGSKSEMVEASREGWKQVRKGGSKPGMVEASLEGWTPVWKPGMVEAGRERDPAA